MSSTPTGRRSHFYNACQPGSGMGFVQHFHPSTHNPGWSEKLEAEFRAMLSEQGYVHEILAEFGSEELGVFNKDRVDAAMRFKYYAYNPLDYYQEQRAKHEEEQTGIRPEILLYDKLNPAPFNPLRTMGIDFDKYGASSSIIIMDYVPELQKFIVLKRIEVPKAEYHYDATVNMIVELNEIFNPSWIYCDSGSGEYQIERLHIYGDEHPESGLKHKVVRRNFRQSLEISDPVTYEIDKKPLKLFMVNQLQIAFERDQVVLSPFDEILHKQLIDYQVEKFTGVTHDPVFTSKNEHFVDALGLAYLAFVLEFNDLIDMVRDTTIEAVASVLRTSFAKKSLNDLYKRANQENSRNGWAGTANGTTGLSDPFMDEPGAKVLVAAPISQPQAQYRSGGVTRGGYGSRRNTRSSSSRRSW